MNSDWSVEFSDDVQHDLAKFDKVIRRRIIEKLDWPKRTIFVHYIDNRSRVYRRK